MTVDDKQREVLGSTPNKPEPSGALTEETELAEACARFADLCQYFSQQNMDPPPQIVDEIQLVSKLAVGERIARMKRLSQEMMKYLNDASPDPQIRQ